MVCCCEHVLIPPLISARVDGTRPGDTSGLKFTASTFSGLRMKNVSRLLPVWLKLGAILQSQVWLCYWWIRDQRAKTCVGDLVRLSQSDFSRDRAQTQNFKLNCWPQFLLLHNNFVCQWNMECFTDFHVSLTDIILVPWH